MSLKTHTADPGNRRATRARILRFRGGGAAMLLVLLLLASFALLAPLHAGLLRYRSLPGVSVTPSMGVVTSTSASLPRERERYVGPRPIAAPTFEEREYLEPVSEARRYGAVRAIFADPATETVRVLYVDGHVRDWAPTIQGGRLRDAGQDKRLALAPAVGWQRLLTVREPVVRSVPGVDTRGQDVAGFVARTDPRTASTSAAVRQALSDPTAICKSAVQNSQSANGYANLCIQFERDSTNYINPVWADRQLSAVVQMLSRDDVRNAKRVKVELVGHTRRGGSAAVNDTLSHARAEKIRQWLQIRVPSNIVVMSEGRGWREPVSFANPQDPVNDRIEMRVILERASNAAVSPDVSPPATGVAASADTAGATPSNAASPECESLARQIAETASRSAGATRGLSAPASNLAALRAESQRRGCSALSAPGRFEAEYAMSGKGIQAGVFTLSASFSNGRYTASASRRMTGVVRTLVNDAQDYSYTASGAFTDRGLRPERYRHEGGKRGRVVEVDFTRDPPVTTATPVMGMGDPPATDAQKSGAIDQLSMLASLLTSNGDPCTRSVRVLMDGRSRFDLVFAGNGSVAVRTAAFTGTATRCSVQFRPIAGFPDPQSPATLTFLFAPMGSGVFAPIRIEMPTDVPEIGVAVLEARKLQIQ